MRSVIPTIYPITDTRLSGLAHAEQARRLIAGGARLLQIREKNLSSIEFFNAAADVMDVARSSGAKILINDRVDIALAVRADGVHLGQNDLPPEKAREILGEDVIIGYSTHSIEHAKRALVLPIDYIAIGPIFETTTKDDPDAIVGLEGLRRVREAVGGKPIVAIGGINENNVAAVLAAGADSAALISSIVSDGDLIEEKIRSLIRQYEQR